MLTALDNYYTLWMICVKQNFCFSQPLWHAMLDIVATILSKSSHFAGLACKLFATMRGSLAASRGSHTALRKVASEGQ
eukprot:6209556-Pleurochrysis_carterae.AAC.1